MMTGAAQNQTVHTPEKSALLYLPKFNLTQSAGVELPHAQLSLFLETWQ